MFWPKRGELVRLRNGSAPLTVDAINSSWLTGTYRNGVTISRDPDQFTYHHENFEDYPMTNPFQRGDRICFKIGHKPLIVTGTNGKYVTAQYEGQTKSVTRSHLDFELISSRRPSPTQRYMTPHGPATVVGQRRDGATVMETFDGPRGRSALVAVTRVGAPIHDYTVRLQNLVDKYTFHRRCEEGQVEKGQLIKRPNGKLYTVIAVDTHASTQQWLEGEVMTGRSI